MKVWFVNHRSTSAKNGGIIYRKPARRSNKPTFQEDVSKLVEETSEAILSDLEATQPFEFDLAYVEQAVSEVVDEVAVLAELSVGNFEFIELPVGMDVKFFDNVYVAAPVNMYAYTDRYGFPEYIMS